MACFLFSPKRRTKGELCRCIPFFLPLILLSSSTTSPQPLGLKQSGNRAIIFSLRKLRPLSKVENGYGFLCVKHTQPQGHSLMCIFDELGILLCIHTAEHCVFANRLSERVTLISFITLFYFFFSCKNTAF